jgi:Domain of unknown function (DUF1839)
MQLIDLDPATYQPHPLHRSDRCWMETNCYVDVWIEVLHALGLDPAASGAFTLSTDFEGDQWTFFKVPPEDLRALYGLEVGEMNVWRPLLDHVVEQLGFGRLLTVEVDSWYLPDTQGVAYRRDHVKSTIVPNMVRTADRRLGYFHNAGYFELDGDDFDGVFRRTAPFDPAVLPPYVEQVKLERLHRDRRHLLASARELTRVHLQRRPTDSPIARLGKRIDVDIDWLAGQEIEVFHQYAFGTCRQCGASAEMAAAFVDWLDLHDGGGLGPTAERFRTVATGAKAVQFGLARVASGRGFSAQGVLDEMSESWETGLGDLADRYGC